MSDFRTKLLGLAAMATMFAGASYGQLAIATAPTVNPVPNGANNLRAEGTTELVGNYQFQIQNGGASGAGTVTIFMSAPVTTPAIPNGFGSTYATLNFNGVNYFGTPSATGTQLVFSGGPGGINIPNGNNNAVVSGVRVNASAVTIGATLTTVTAQGSVTVNNVSAAATLPTAVGYVFPTLNPAGVNGSNTGAFPPTLPPTYNTAQGNTVKNNPAPSFFISIGDGVAGAFKVFGSAGTAGTEDFDNHATFGTRVQLAFGNVPSAVTLYVPTSISNGSFIFNLVTSATAPDGAGTVPTATASTAFGIPSTSNAGNNGSYTYLFSTSTYGQGVFALVPSGGSAVAVYEVTQVPAVPATVSIQVPVWEIFAPNVLTTAPGAMTVLETYAPMSAAAAATTVPNFAVVTTGGVNGPSIALAFTGLLFPFVTNAPGFDTGIAISNTTTDPFGTTPTSGTCSLNFYGSGAPTPATSVPAPGGAQASGTSNAFLLSSLAPNFSGYMIANCAYPFAHGFAYIIYNFGQSSGSALGYLATVLNRPSAPGLAPPNSEAQGN